jgi:hypothetical protein
VSSEQRLFAYDGMESTTTHLAYEGENWDKSIQTVSVPTRRLDDLAETRLIPFPDFVKVDVEGHGHRDLAGAAGTLAHARRVLLCAFHSAQEIDGIRAVLDSLGYTFEPILPTAPAVPTVGFDYIARPAKR